MRAGEAVRLATAVRLPTRSQLLRIDREYRRLAKGGRLRYIAPRLNNPLALKWLPVWRTSQGDWDYRVQFSNTTRAHQHGATHSWVIIHASRGRTRRRYTVVTDRSGHRTVLGL